MDIPSLQKMLLGRFYWRVPSLRWLIKRDPRREEALLKLIKESYEEGSRDATARYLGMDRKVYDRTFSIAIKILEEQQKAKENGIPTEE